ncbi:MAG: lamin tail domain-containing protein [Actinomycetota bacterium]
MRRSRPISRLLRGNVLAVVAALALVATLLSPVQPAGAQDGNTVVQTVVNVDSGRVWKTHRDGVEQNTAWRQLGFDDSTWDDEPMKFYEAHGTVTGDGFYAYYFREEFEITDVFQISELQLDLYYDDAAVLYLNGTEVYRSIRNNLPSVEEIPVGGVIPVDTLVNVGGAEDYYVQIPADSNYCEHGCINDGATSPIDVELLEEGTNVFAVMAWTRPTSDLGFDLGIDVVRNLDAPPPDQVVINELMASNETEQDEDGDTSDWFEIHNPGDDPIDLDGWVVQDTATSWTFPAVTIAAGGHLRLWASDKDRSPTDGSPLHTNFKLSRELDSLRITGPDSIVRDDTGILPRQIADVSYGRPNDTGELTYLATPSPGSANSAAASTLAPVLRPFSNRLFNLGEAIDLQLDAFDPEGQPLTYLMPNSIGLTVDSGTGQIIGTADTIGEFEFTIDVSDGGLSATQPVTFTIVEAPSSTTPLILNEYNAVAPERELTGGVDAAFGPVLGNGGDWYEFVVVEDLLDLRGWTLQFWDRDRNDDILERAAALTFADDFALAALAAGTIITISEDRPDDLSFDPGSGDWTINLQASSQTPGAMFSIQESFNSTRDDQYVEIRDASGALRSPVVGETEAWDDAIGGVNGGEVMNLCIDPTSTTLADPVEHYRDNSTESTYGAPNKCTFVDPLDPGGAAIITFDQDFSALRSTAGVRGDVNCDGDVNVIDALFIAQFAVGNRSDTTTCPLGDPAAQINLGPGDFNVEEGVDIVDALLIAQCAAAIARDPYC